MVLYDLTETAIAISAEPIPPPRDHELLAVTIALLHLEDRSYGELVHHSVALTPRNHRRVAELIEERTPFLARDFGDPVRLRARLKELVGMRISREF